MTPITAASEAPQAATTAGASDAVTLAFADEAADCCATLRLGLSIGADGVPQASGLAVLFSGTEPVAARAAGGIPVGGMDWDIASAAGVSTAVLAPLGVWRFAFASEDGTSGFEVDVHAVSPPWELSAEDPVTRAGGVQGYEQLVRVTGTVKLRGGRRRLDCLGQRGHTWGATDWDKVALTRQVSAWMGDDLGVSLAAVRTRKAKHHSDETLAATLWAPEPVEVDDAAEPAAVALADAPREVAPRALPEVRLSSTLDPEGRQRRATIEVFEDPDGYPHRFGGEVICGTTLDLGRLRLETAFFTWHGDGRAGRGRYDVLRRA